MVLIQPDQPVDDALALRRAAGRDPEPGAGHVGFSEGMKANGFSDRSIKALCC